MAILVLGGSCGRESRDGGRRPATYVGAVQGTNALIAVVAGATTAVAYVCDSEQLAAEFSGSLDGDTFDASGRGRRLSFRVTKAGAKGTVSLAGRRHDFDARPVAPPSGFFRADGAVNGSPTYAGWVVAPDGEQRGAVVDRNTGDISVGFSAIDPTRPGLTVIGGQQVPIVRVIAAGLG